MYSNRLLGLTITSQARNLVIVVIIYALYLFENYGPGFIVNEPIFVYIFKPLLWALLIFLIFCLPHPREKAKIKLKSFLVWMTVLLAGGYILLLMIAGISFGFGKSPYDHTMLGILMNLLRVFAALIGRELSRNYLINNYNGRSRLRYFAFITLFMTFISISPKQIINLKTNLDIVQFLGEELLTKLSGNIFATYLVYMGGAPLSIIYFGIQEGFNSLSPIIPNMNWVAKTFLGALFPAFGALFLHFNYNSELKVTKAQTSESENPAGWFITSAVCILIVWFVIGVFPVRPYVIATGSMEPVIYPGDMVLVKRLDTNDLKVGDIIQYESDNVYIFHRIIEVVEDKREIKYKTKGDNNSSEDAELIKLEKVRGCVIFTVPKIGYPSLIFRRSDDAVKEKYTDTQIENRS